MAEKQQVERQKPVCPYCDVEIIDADLPWCKSCHVKIVHCQSCQRPLPAHAKSCPDCGQPVGRDEAEAA